MRGFIKRFIYIKEATKNSLVAQVRNSGSFIVPKPQEERGGSNSMQGWNSHQRI